MRRRRKCRIEICHDVQLEIFDLLQWCGAYDARARERAGVRARAGGRARALQRPLGMDGLNGVVVLFLQARGEQPVVFLRGCGTTVVFLLHCLTMVRGGGERKKKAHS